MARALGLSEWKAARRLAEDGPNVLPRLAPPSAVRALVRQFTHPLAAPPWVAAGLAFLAGTPALAISIVLVIVLDALFAFWQEHRADRSAERLRDLLPAIALGVEPPSNRVMFPLLAAVLLVLADAALKQLRSIRRRRTATEAIGRT